MDAISFANLIFAAQIEVILNVHSHLLDGTSKLGNLKHVSRWRWSRSLTKRNHTFFVNVDDGFKLTLRYYVKHKQLVCFNKSDDPKINRNCKLLSHIVSTDENYSNMRHLDNMLVEIMPRVIAFIMEHHKCTEKKRFNDIFMLMREWSLPLLYTSSAGPEPRKKWPNREEHGDGREVWKRSMKLKSLE